MTEAMTRAFDTWLAALCSGRSGAQATLWQAKAEGALDPLAHRGAEEGTLERHRIPAQTAAGAGRPVIQAGDNADLLAAAHGDFVVVLEQSSTSPREQETALRELESAVRWLVWSRNHTQTPGAAKPDEADLPELVDFVALALEPQPAKATALALSTELASHLSADRVSVGYREAQTVSLRAVSHSPAVDARSDLVRSIVQAMEEAIEQDAVIQWPSPEDSGLALGAHRELAKRHGAAAAWSYPLRHGDEIIGALCVEFRSRGHGTEERRAFLGRLTPLLAPILDLRERDDAGVWKRARILLEEDLPRALGWERLQARFAFAAVAALLLLLGVIPGTQRVAAPAELEGVVQRAIVSPMPAFVAESRRRAGDTVRSGEVLGVLDDAELLLEQRKWNAKREQRWKELRAAMATEDRANVRILRAQVDQADAELELVTEQLKRTRLVAPFDGIITQGDLSQSLGSPVDRGEVLFEVAPLDDFRVIVEVDDRDISQIEIGQAGALTLASLPGEPRAFRVERVTPISTAEDGRNYFRVEGALTEASTELRPGMDGVAKIDVGRRSLLFLLTHSAIDWVQLKWWAWVP